MRLLLAVLVLLAVPATAVASDRTLERSWSRYRTEVKSVARDFRMTGEIDDFKALSSLYGQLGRAARDTARSVASDAATTLTGGAAQEAALDHLRPAATGATGFRRAFALLVRSARLQKQGMREQAHRVAKRFRQLAKAAAADFEVAARGFRRANKLFGAIARAS